MIPLRLSTGEPAELVSLDGIQAVLVSPRPFAPGAPMSFEALVEPEPVALEGKSHGSKRRPDDRFDVRLRLVNLRRADRERLASLLGS